MSHHLVTPDTDLPHRLWASLGIAILAAVALAASPISAEDAATCAPLDAPLVAYENSETPFPVRIRQPEGWNTLSQAGGKMVDFFEGETESGSLFLLRFFVASPMDAELIRKMWSGADPEAISEVEIEGGGELTIRHSERQTNYLATVPIADDQVHLVTASVVHARDPCKASALELLGRIVRGLRPRDEPEPGRR